MNDSKYRTIDPLILQTLNLNEARMNHILNIIHGKEDHHNYAKTERRPIRPLSKNRTISVIHQDQSALPPIKTIDIKSNQRMTERPSPKRFFTLNKNKSNDQLITNQSIDKSRTVQKRQKSPKRYEVNYKSQKKIQKSRQLEKDLVNIDEQISKMQIKKKQQIMKNYMMSNIKRSKSQDLNPKDIYRMEIETIVADLTPIQQLQDAEKKMQRLKRRYKHLAHFDKNYYLRINQIDMLNLA